MKFDDYVQEAMDRNGFTSDRQLSAALGKSNSLISQVRTGRMFLDDATMMQLAQLAGRDPVLALLDLNTWRAKDPAVKTAYRKLSERLGTVAKMTGGGLGIVAIASSLTLGKPPARAAAADCQNARSYTLCDFGRRLRRWLRPAADELAAA